MTVNYTTNLALGQPVTGTESGTWGDDVNNAVTSYLDIAIAGGLAITVTTADVTLTLTQGTSSATNIGSTTAQYAILNVSGAMTAARNLILPSSSRQYVINNACTGGFLLTVKGSATTGVTLVNGEKAHVFWNGSDYAKLSNTPGGAGTFSSITNTGLTSGRVVYSTTGGLETDSANLTFNGTTLTANTIGAFTLSGTIAGGGNQLNNVVIGTTTPLAGSFTTLTASGLISSTAGNNANIFLSSGATTGYQFMRATNTSGDMLLGVEGATPALIAGSTAYDTVVRGTTGISFSADNGTSKQMRLSSSGLEITQSQLIGYSSYAGIGTNGLAVAGNVGVGTSSPNARLHIFQDSASTSVMSGAYIQNYSFTNNSQAGIGFFAADNFNAKIYTLRSGSSAGNLVFATNSGAGTGESNVVERARIDSSGNVGIGTSSPSSQFVVSNAGAAGLEINPTGVASSPVILSYDRSGGGYIQLTALALRHVWLNSGTEVARIDSSGNLLVGKTATAIGTVGAELRSIGLISSTLAGSTSSTSTLEVYSTGAAAYRFYVDMAGTIFATSIVITAISDQRLKENIRDIDTGLNAIMALKPRRFDWKEGKGQDKKNVAGFIAQEFEEVFPECVSTSKAGADGIEYKNINHETLIPTLVKAIQEQQALITSLTARITALESKEIS